MKWRPLLGIAPLEVRFRPSTELISPPYLAHISPTSPLHLPCISPVSRPFEVRFRPSTELNTANQLGRLVVQLSPGLSSGGGAKKAGVS